jgi:hypothetical protein
MKTEMEIEALLIWAYRDELSKRQTSSAEGIWDRILEEGQRGGGIDRDPGHGAAQRYAHFGLPDPDAERIEKAVGGLEDTVIDWKQSFTAIAGELAGLISINDIAPRSKPPKAPKSSWSAAGTKAIKAWWGEKGAAPLHSRPRDVLMVGSMRTGALVTMHAVKGSRPQWMEESPRPFPIPASRGSNPEVVGDCRGKNLYTIGSYCPLRWDPSPLSIVMSRAEYVAWHYGLAKLAEILELEKFTVLPPKAPRLPWLDGAAPPRRVIRTPSKSMKTLPLGPLRDRAGPPRRHPKAGPVRSVDLGAKA